uniref:Uncharacterized protein n=1 Tax=Meloidogyne enterolobii TaxID=390850 RepID=A0A6V7UEY7_MELEN|nr:unnamed protein product [Meloidogyne enterolobii]
MKIKTPKHFNEWDYFDRYEESNQNSKPIKIVLEQKSSSYKVHIIYWCIILYIVFVADARHNENKIKILKMQEEIEKMSKKCPSQNNGTTKLNEIKIQKMEREIKEIVKEQAKLNEKIKILEDTKTDLGKLVEQMKYLEEKIAVIDDKENKRFDAFYEETQTNLNILQKSNSEHSKRIDIIENEISSDYYYKLRLRLYKKINEYNKYMLEKF